MDKSKEIRLKVLRALCEHEWDWMSSWIPLPTTVIARLLGVSLYQCRKAMKQLVAEGLAESNSCIVNGEECRLPYHGFRLTAAGKETGIYKYVALQSARENAINLHGSVTHFLPEGFDLRWLSRHEHEQAAKELKEMMNLSGDISDILKRG